VANLFERLAAARPTSAEAKQPQKDPAQKLLDWLRHRKKSTITVREICVFGPYSIRNRKSAIDAIEVLVKYGWLDPLKPRRHDAPEWEIVQKPIIYPTVPTEAAE
jgi:hypothetical protein